MLGRCMNGSYFRRRSYISNQAIYPGVGQVIPSKILSDMTQICGQEHRSSMNFQVGSTSSGANIWQVNAGEGITFDIWQDIPHGTDTKLYNDVENGAQIKLNPSIVSGTNSYYIANPDGAESAFYVTLTPVNLVIPPPPPPPPS